MPRSGVIGHRHCLQTSNAQCCFAPAPETNPKKHQARRTGLKHPPVSGGSHLQGPSPRKAMAYSSGLEGGTGGHVAVAYRRCDRAWRGKPRRATWRGAQRAATRMRQPHPAHRPLPPPHPAAPPPAALQAAASRARRAPALSVPGRSCGERCGAPACAHAHAPLLLLPPHACITAAYFQAPAGQPRS